ncbi:Rrf2 family transcriptional regulator [Chryseobacterium sp. A321]
MNNTRFATHIHILTLLAKFPDEWLTSEWIAESICVNPVIVRKELSILKQFGWVHSKKGKDGGSQLAVATTEISIGDIYNGVKNSNVLGKKNNCDSTKCLVGKEINLELETLFKDTDSIVSNYLKTKTLTDFVEQFH